MFRKAWTLVSAGGIGSGSFRVNKSTFLFKCEFAELLAGRGWIPLFGNVDDFKDSLTAMLKLGAEEDGLFDIAFPFGLLGIAGGGLGLSICGFAVKGLGKVDTSGLGCLGGGLGSFFVGR